MFVVSIIVPVHQIMIETDLGHADWSLPDEVEGDEHTAGR